MKLNVITLALATGLLVSCGPTTQQTTSANAAMDVPASITANFQAQYPTATNVTWNRYDASTAAPIDWELVGWAPLDNNDYVVTFDVGTDRYYAWYDSNGTWIGTTYNIGDFSMLPASIHSMIRDKYQGYAIVDVDKEMWQSQTAYEVKLKRDDAKIKLLVDNNGNVIKEKMKD